MTLPITPIVPIHEALSVAAGSAASATSATSPTPLVAPEQAQKFRELMQRTHEEGASGALAGPRGDNAIARVLQSQQNEFKQAEDIASKFVQNAGSMDPLQTATASAGMIATFSKLHIKMSVAEGVSKTSNKSLDSLLKNQ